MAYVVSNIGNERFAMVEHRYYVDLLSWFTMVEHRYYIGHNTHLHLGWYTPPNAP